MLVQHLKTFSILVCAGTLTATPANAQSPALLLFDGETGEVFAGCLNCNRLDDASVCNRYGDYGSRYSEKSIWNRYGKFGSRYENNSPWSRYGEGLRVVDADGNYYGRFSLASYGQSKHPLVQAILKAYEENDDLSDLRDLLCDT
jgi:hypothetical protein